MLARVSCGAAAAAAAARRTAACSVQQLHLLGGVEVRRRERGRGTAELSLDLDSPIIRFGKIFQVRARPSDAFHLNKSMIKFPVMSHVFS